MTLTMLKAIEITIIEVLFWNPSSLLFVFLFVLVLSRCLKGVLMQIPQPLTIVSKLASTSIGNMYINIRF